MAAYLKDFKGYVHSDGYSGYGKLKGVTRCGCWAHLRRKFAQAIPPGKAVGSELSPAETARAYCNKLFTIEDELKDLILKIDTTSVLTVKNRFSRPFGRGLKR